VREKEEVEVAKGSSSVLVGSGVWRGSATLKVVVFPSLKVDTTRADEGASVVVDELLELDELSVGAAELLSSGMGCQNTEAGEGLCVVLALTLSLGYQSSRHAKHSVGDSQQGS
jgi:hypothetical protein